VIGNDHCQSRFAFLGCEIESVSVNPRSGAHEGIAEARPAHQLDDRPLLGFELVGRTTRTLVIFTYVAAITFPSRRR
jgi:hypothetical protein